MRAKLFFTLLIRKPMGRQILPRAVNHLNWLGARALVCDGVT